MIATSSRTSSGWISGTGLAIAKTIGSRRHGAHRGRRHRARARDADEHVGAAQDVVGHAALAAGVRARGERRALGVEAGAPRVERALDVADDHVLHAVGEDDLRARDAGGAGADDHDLDLAGVLAHHAQRVDQRGEDDDRRAVLVVVEDRDVELGAQPALDLEAARRRDVLEVDARRSPARPP